MKYREPLLPAAPFAAWLAQLRLELGGWRQVGELIGADSSAAHRWGTGQTQRFAVRICRSAQNAGTTLNAIYSADGLALAEASAAAA
ncbi:MAG: hypothetical protein ABSG43_11400 [Solirubrobacteraceae bacterium]|jgi:hypothetical protein